MRSRHDFNHLADAPCFGFTLLEMVLVLAILAVLAAVAVRSLTGVEDQTRFTSTQQQLAQIQYAIDGDPSIRQPDGSRIPNGFVNDMGRLPAVIGTDGKTQLQELWVQPAGVAPYAIVSAPGNDSDIRIGTGWHGPYLQLPIGQTTLFDGWANPFSITATNDNALASIQSLGSDNVVGTTANDVYSADLPASPLAFSSLEYSTTVTVIASGSSLPTTAKLFEPDGLGGATFLTGTGTITAGETLFTFNPVSPGNRIIRLYDDSSTPLATQYILVPKGGIVVNIATTQPSATQPSLSG